MPRLRRIRGVSPERAEKCLWNLFAAIQTLEEMPEGCPLIPEGDLVSGSHRDSDRVDP